MLEDLDDRQLLARMAILEGEYNEIREKIKKLEHGRMWVENRLTSLEINNEPPNKDQSITSVKEQNGDTPKDSKVESEMSA